MIHWDFSEGPKEGTARGAASSLRPARAVSGDKAILLWGEAGASGEADVQTGREPSCNIRPQNDRFDMDHGELPAQECLISLWNQRGAQLQLHSMSNIFLQKLEPDTWNRIPQELKPNGSRLTLLLPKLSPLACSANSFNVNSLQPRLARNNALGKDDASINTKESRCFLGFGPL